MTLLVALTICLAAANSPAHRALQPFDYKNVTIDSGPFREQIDQVKDYYLRIPNDDLLKGFRQRAGRDAPGVDLGGWYSADVFHILGQIVSGLSRLYATTRDPACKAKVLTLVSEWGKCIAPDGYFYYSKTPNAPHYIYDKTVCGLVDAYLYCGDKEALTCLSKITDWAVKNLSRERTYAFNAGNGYTEWYTLTENLYRAYQATHDRKYLDFGKVWEYTDYWNLYAYIKDIFSKAHAYHAYSHVNTLSGAGAAYAITGQAHYLDTLTNAYAYLTKCQCFATGGFGPNESLLPASRIPATLNDWTNHFETQCGTWAVFKLSKYLVSFTGEAKYGDWAEQLAYNGLCATIPMSPDGRVFYYSEYNVNGSAKRNAGEGWTCCAGTRPQAVAEVADQIYYHDDTDLFVNLYIPSTVHWRGVTVNQETRFPEADTVTFRMTASKPTSFWLRMRIPAWTGDHMEVLVNNKPVEVLQQDGDWRIVHRAWRTSDTVTIRLPMSFSLHPISPTKPYPAALNYGPITMAFRGQQNPGAIDLSKLVSSPGEPLTYHYGPYLVRPLYALKEGEPYYVYLDPASRNRVSWRSVKLDKWYGDAGYMRFTNTVGATAEYEFTGTGIRWLGQKFDDGGQGQVEIDGKVVQTVDMYGPGRGLPFDWSIRGLPPGRHRIRITLLESKTEASKGRFLNLQGFEVTP